MRQINLFKVFLSDDVLPELSRTFQSGYIGQGSKVVAFEEALRGTLGSKRVLTTNSGTSALHLALHLLKAPVLFPDSTEHSWPGLQEGDEVLTTPLTCVATNWPILANGLRIRWADVSKEDLNIDPRSIAAQLSPRTKLIMIVHWGGYAANLRALDEVLVSAEADLGFRPIIIEDCAHAFGSTYRGAPIGAHGNMCAFSFQAVKSVTCGDGGALCVPTDELFRRATLLRWYGIDRSASEPGTYHERDVTEWGYKFHMNDICATIGLANLPHLDWMLQRQRAHAAFYDEYLGRCNGITLLSYQPDRQSSYYLYTIRVEKREEFQEWLRKCGIEARRVHARNDWHSCVDGFRAPLPILDQIYDQIICLPVGWWLNDDDLEKVVKCISSGW